MNKGNTKDHIENILANYFLWIKDNDGPEYAQTLKEGINAIDPSLQVDHLYETIEVTDKNILDLLSNEVEFSSGRKRKGAYYTPNDVVNYITYNLFFNYLNTSMDVQVLPIEKIISKKYNVDKVLDLCINKSFLDPTCGAGEFALSVLKAKIRFLKLIGKNSIENILSAVSTIYGNDIDKNATLVSKLRIFIYIYKSNLVPLNKELWGILSSNFSNYDFVLDEMPIKQKFDLILGNPPYVEYRTLKAKPATGYGNIYADVMHNTNNHLNIDGAISYVVPISFSSTLRMKDIRNEEIHSFSKLIAIHFADRPDSLFSSVHQKVEIIIASGFEQPGNDIYTSKYNYWYKDERPHLFENIRIIKNDDYDGVSLPKYGCSTQKSIYKKVTDFGNRQLSDFLIRDNKEKYDGIYLAKRAAFYIKSFFNNPGSNEYDHYRVEQISSKALLAILNSTLFWMYWVIVSDGWHLTNKELSTFTLPMLTQETDDKLSNIADQLIKRLEETKVYVGTVQTDYEYKHKQALDIIDKIDDILGEVYGLSPKELAYVKSYERKYRGGK